jgi:hypothetical protein
MTFTIPLTDLEGLLKAIVPRPRKTSTVTLSACAGRVFVEYKGDIGGVEATVF